MTNNRSEFNDPYRVESRRLELETPTVPLTKAQIELVRSDLKTRLAQAEEDSWKGLEHLGDNMRAHIVPGTELILHVLNNEESLGSYAQKRVDRVCIEDELESQGLTTEAILIPFKSHS
jgi:hypothetical protein